MTKDLISQARELLAKATPGPWVKQYLAIVGKESDLVFDSSSVPYAIDSDDQALIIFARNHMEEILDAIELQIHDNLQIGKKLEQQAKAIEVMKSELSWHAGKKLNSQRIIDDGAGARIALGKVESILSGESGEQ